MQIRAFFLSLMVGGVLFRTAAPLHAFVNGGFETGDMTGWTVTYGAGTGPLAQAVTGGTAPNTNGNLNRVDVGLYSCELFSGTGGAGTTYARISQSDLVTAGNTLLQFRYAGVLDGSHSSTPLQDASVEVSVNLGATTVYSGTYRYASSPAALVNDGLFPYLHLPWTTITIDLSAYVGQTVTVSFAAIDCLQGGHSSRAYVDGFDFVAPSPTSTITPSITQTSTLTVTETNTQTPTLTPTLTVTQTSTATPTVTWTPSITPTFTHTISVTPTFTRTVTPTYTPTPRPLMLKLLPPSPNPSNGAEGTWIPYFLSTDADVRIEVWTLAGELTRSMHPGWRLAGYREDFWDQRNEGGNKVASGIFIYRVRARSAFDEEKQDFSKCAVTR